MTFYCTVLYICKDFGPFLSLAALLGYCYADYRSDGACEGQREDSFKGDVSYPIQLPVQAT